MSPEGKKSRTVEILDRRGENKRRNEDAKELLIVPRQQHIEKKLKRVSRYFLFRSPNFHSALFLRSFITDKWRVRACLPFGSQEFGFFSSLPRQKNWRIFINSPFLFLLTSGFLLSIYTLVWADVISQLIPLVAPSFSSHTKHSHTKHTHTHIPLFPSFCLSWFFFLHFSRTLNMKGEIRVLMIQINTYLPQ